MCQGWQEILWDETGPFINKHYNLCVGKFEKGAWSDKNNKLNCPQRESHEHNHALL